MKKLLIGVLVASIILMPILAMADDGVPLGENKGLVGNLLLVFPNLLTEELINQLRAQGYGYGVIAIICVIATESDKNLEEVISYAEENDLGWGEVASYLGVKLSKLRLTIKKVERIAKFFILPSSESLLILILPFTTIRETIYKSIYSCCHVCMSYSKGTL